MARRDGEGEGANNDGGRAGAGAGGRGGRGEGREGGRGDGGWRHSIAVRRLVQRVGVAGGGVVLSSFTHPSSRATRNHPRVIRVRLRSPTYPRASHPLPAPARLRFCPLPSRFIPPCVLSRATPLLILLQTGSIPSPPASQRHPRADPREVRWSDTRRCVYVR